MRKAVRHSRIADLPRLRSTEPARAGWLFSRIYPVLLRIHHATNVEGFARTFGFTYRRATNRCYSCAFAFLYVWFIPGLARGLRSVTKHILRDRCPPNSHNAVCDDTLPRRPHQATQLTRTRGMAGSPNLRTTTGTSGRVRPSSAPASPTS